MVERYERLESDIRSGMQDKVIADKHKVSTRMVQRARRYFGLHKPARRIPAEHFEAALELLKDGASYRDAGETYDISPTRLRDKYPGYGWGHNPVLSGQHGAIMKKLHRLDGKHPWAKHRGAVGVSYNKI